MALYPFVHVSALELHALSRYPGNRQNDRMTDRNTNRLPYAFTAHAHRGITVYYSYTQPHSQAVWEKRKWPGIHCLCMCKHSRIKVRILSACGTQLVKVSKFSLHIMMYTLSKRLQSFSVDVIPVEFKYSSALFNGVTREIWEDLSSRLREYFLCLLKMTTVY